MPQYGLTDQGFKVKDLNTISKELKDAFKMTFGASINTGPDSVIGQMVDVFAAQLAEGWEQGEAVYNAFDRNSATGDALDNVASLVGLERFGAEPTVGQVTFTGDVGTTIPLGTVVRNPDTDDRFEVTKEVTIATGQSTVSTSIECTETGPTEADPNTVTAIVTAVSGLESVDNAAKFVAGRLVESDADLRLRIKESLQIGGKSVDQAIKAELLETEGVSQAIVLSNRSLTTDSNGIQGKSFESVLWPASADADYREAIAKTIFLAQPAGIRADGDITMNVEDSQGYDQEVRFSFATEQQILVTANLGVNSRYPANGDAQVAEIIKSVSQEFGVGQDIKFLKYVSAIYNEVEGVDDISIQLRNATNIATVPDDNLVIEFTQIGLVDEANITVNS
jgi:uncharacterized phage protein gp47/JayE